MEAPTAVVNIGEWKDDYKTINFPDGQSLKVKVKVYVDKYGRWLTGEEANKFGRLKYELFKLLGFEVKYP